MQKIGRVNVAKRVAENITKLIGAEQYQPGTRLPSEQELCEELAVGRTSVREGLKLLESSGLIEIRHGDGSYVKGVDMRTLLDLNPPLPHLILLKPQEIRDIIDVRRTLELQTVTLATERRSERQLQQLRDDLKAMNEAIADLDEYIRADLEFHVNIAKASGNIAYPALIRFVCDMYLAYWQRFVREMEQAEHTRCIMHESLSLHEPILHGIETGQPALARAAMQTHLDEHERVVTRYIEDLREREGTDGAPRRDM